MYTSHKQELIKGVYADIFGRVSVCSSRKKGENSEFFLILTIWPDLPAYFDLFSVYFSLNYKSNLNLSAFHPYFIFFFFKIPPGRPLGPREGYDNPRWGLSYATPNGGGIYVT